MFNRSNLLVIAIAICGALLGLYAGTYIGQPRLLPPGASLKPGERLVDVPLRGADGQPRHLSEWGGKLLVVNFWATWCEPCRDEMPLLDRTRARLVGKGVEVVGVAVDDADAVADFLKVSPVRYPILLGADNQTLLNFGDGSGVLPYSVLIGRDGKLLSQRAGSFSDAGLNRWLEPHLDQ